MEQSETTSQSERAAGISIKNGRLVFPNSDVFENKFYEFTDKSLSDLYDFMEPFYNQGFYSLRPPAVVGYHQNEVLLQYKNRVKHFKKTSNINNYSNTEISKRIAETSFIVPNTTIATFLNPNGEMQIGTAILKFTDVGIFVIESDKYYPNLKTYLDGKQISKNLLNPTDENIARTIFNTYTEGLVPNTRGIYYHQKVAPPQDPPIAGTGGWGGNPGYPGNSDNGNDLDGLTEYVNNLSPCDSRDSLFGSIFGVYKTCTNHYANDRRVRTDAYNISISWHNWIDIELYSVGINVRNQIWYGIDFLGIGAWFQKKADVVAAGVQKFQVKYDYSSILTPPNIYNLNTQAVQYSYQPGNISYFVDTDIWNGTSYYDLIFTSNYPAYPEFIQDGLVIEGIGNNTIVDYLITQGEEAATSQELNELFWNTVYDNATSQLSSLNPAYENPNDVALISNYPNHAVIIAHKTFFDHCTDCRDANESFGFQGGAGISLSYNPSNGRFDYGAGAPGTSLVYPDDMRVKMYGAIKYNGSWHGSLLEHNLE